MEKFDFRYACKRFVFLFVTNKLYLNYKHADKINRSSPGSFFSNLFASEAYMHGLSVRKKKVL